MANLKGVRKLNRIYDEDKRRMNEGMKSILSSILRWELANVAPYPDPVEIRRAISTDSNMEIRDALEVEFDIFHGHSNRTCQIPLNGLGIPKIDGVELDDGGGCVRFTFNRNISKVLPLPSNPAIRLDTEIGRRLRDIIAKHVEVGVKFEFFEFAFRSILEVCESPSVLRYWFSAIDTIALMHPQIEATWGTLNDPSYKEYKAPKVYPHRGILLILKELTDYIAWASILWDPAKDYPGLMHSIDVRAIRAERHGVVYRV